MVNNSIPQTSSVDKAAYTPIHFAIINRDGETTAIALPDVEAWQPLDVVGELDDEPLVINWPVGVVSEVTL